MPAPDNDSGHALIEAIVLGLVLLVPVIWMLSVFSELHGAALGTTSAAREAGFEASRSNDPVSADREIQRVVALSLTDHGLDPSLTHVSWSPTDGWRRGGGIEVVVTYEVPVFQAPLLGQITGPAIPVTATHVTDIQRYRSHDG